MTLAKAPAGGPAGVLAFVLAHNAGDLLQPLTADRCKPAVPFEGKHLLIDFVLSNLVNSGIYSIYVLASISQSSGSQVNRMLVIATRIERASTSAIAVVNDVVRAEAEKLAADGVFGF